MSLRIHGSVDLDGHGWQSGLHTLDGVVEHATSELKEMVIGSLGVGAIEYAIRRTIEYGEKVVDTSRRLGISTEALQEFGFAARQNGAEMEALIGFIERINSNRNDPTKVKFWAKLGIDTSDLEKLTAEELITKISENAQNRSSQELIGPLRQIGGKGAGEMLPMLKDNLVEVRAQAVHLGVVMSTGVAVELKNVNEKIKLLSQELTVSMAPAIVWLSQQAEKSIRFFRELAKRGFGAKKIASLVGMVSPIFPLNIIIAIKQPDLLKEFFEKGQAAEAAARMGLEAEARARLERQKRLERLNALPDFPDATPLQRFTTNAFLEIRDPLLSVGNFLGSTRGLITMIDVERQKLDAMREWERHVSMAVQHELAYDGGGSNWLTI